MWTDAILAYLHFGAILTLIWFLAKEWTLLRAGAANVDAERLANADAGFGITALAVLVTGALRVVYGAKGWAFYAHNPAFHAKVTLFVIVGLVSIAPTRAFIRWRNARRADARYAVSEADWKRARRFLMIELHLIALIPLLAVIMSRGLWLASAAR
jgi:putative membrane protein